MSTSSKTQSGSGPVSKDFSPSWPLCPVRIRCPADAKRSAESSTISRSSSTMSTFAILFEPPRPACGPALHVSCFASKPGLMVIFGDLLHIPHAGAPHGVASDDINGPDAAVSGADPRDGIDREDVRVRGLGG